MSEEHAPPPPIDASRSQPTVANERPRAGSRHKRLVLGLLVLAAIVVAAWLVRGRIAGGPSGAAASASAAGDRAVPVVIVPVERRDMPVYLEGLGSVAAFYTATVKPLVEGRLDTVAFREGQAVKKGDLLAQIDPRPFSILLRQAEATRARDEASLRNARVNFERYATLREQSLVAQQQVDDQRVLVDQAAATLRGDEAQIASARLQLDYARITSPIDGVTGMRQVDPGNVVHPSDPNGLVVVTQLDPIAVLFTLPEGDLPRVSRQMSEGKVNVEVLGRDNDSALAKGELALIDNQINAQTATIRLKAVFANPAHSLWPNQFVRARLLLATRKGALLVPAAVVQRGPQGTFAYVVGSDDRAAMRPVEVDMTQGETSVIAKGLNEGDRVVAEGQFQLRPGSRVASRPAEKASARAAASGSAAPRPSASAP